VRERISRRRIGGVVRNASSGLAGNGCGSVVQDARRNVIRLVRGSIMEIRKVASTALAVWELHWSQRLRFFLNVSECSCKPVNEPVTIRT
jgi:hypothetical protein